jgi:hypothetical protein
MKVKYETAKECRGCVSSNDRRLTQPKEKVETCVWGWFDPNPVAKQDLMQGYFADYLDIQQSTSLRDSIFERKPTPVQEETPYGRLGERTIYSLL